METPDLSTRFHIGFNKLMSKTFLWAITLIVLSVVFTLSSGQNQYTVPVMIPLCVFSALLCLVSVATRVSKGYHRHANAFLMVAHCVTLSLHGLRFWTGTAFDFHSTSCFMPAMQFLASTMSLPLSMQMLPMTLAVVIPLGAYPHEFLMPVPLVLLVCSFIVTIVSCPSARLEGLATVIPLQSSVASSPPALAHTLASVSGADLHSDRQECSSTIRFVGHVVDGRATASRERFVSDRASSIRVSLSHDDGSSNEPRGSVPDPVRSSLSFAGIESARVIVSPPPPGCCHPNGNDCLVYVSQLIADPITSPVIDMISFPNSEHGSIRSSKRVVEPPRCFSPNCSDKPAAFTSNQIRVGSERCSTIEIASPNSECSPSGKRAEKVSDATSAEASAPTLPLRAFTHTCPDIRVWYDHDPLLSTKDKLGLQKLNEDASSSSDKVTCDEAEWNQVLSEAKRRLFIEKKFQDQRRLTTELLVKLEAVTQRCTLLADLKKKMEEEMSLRHCQVQELQLKLTDMKESSARGEETRYKLESQCMQQDREIRELKIKYGILKETCEQDRMMKEKAEQDLANQSRQARDLKAKLNVLKVHFDKGVEDLHRAKSDLEEQQQIAEQLKEKCDSLECQKSAEIGLSEVCSKAAAIMAAKPKAFQGHNRAQNVDNDESEGAEFEWDTHSTITNISHDMRTPLTTALAALDILRDEKVKLETSDSRDLIQKAWAALQNILIMVNNILDHTKLKNVGVTPIARQVNFRRLAVQTLRTLEVQANLSQVELVLFVDHALPTTMMCDRILLHRILLNLLANALNGSPVLGRVSLFIGWDEQRSVLKTAVADSGDGMNSSEIAALFHQLYQGSHGKGGAGLGLSICHSLISEMGGCLSVHSEGKGHGSTFRFEIPMAVEKIFTSSMDLSALVIDPDEVRRSATEEMLRYVGVCVLKSDDHGQPPVGIVFIFALMDSRDAMVRFWKQRQVTVCVVVPNTCPWKLHQLAPADCVLRSPIDVVELRAVLRKVADCSQSDTSSSVIRVSNSIPPVEVNVNEILVLVVEDNQINHKLFLRQLANVGLTQVHSAFNGAEAIQLAQENRYSVIIMDCQMPVVDGFEATLRIREIAFHATTPIIALTANQSSENVRRCRACGMTEFFSKPVTPQNWQAILDIAIKRVQTHKENPQ